MNSEQRKAAGITKRGKVPTGRPSGNSHQRRKDKRVGLKAERRKRLIKENRMIVDVNVQQ